ncbi:outer membrane beta-barrel protein [Flavobacterium sp. 7A]|uniref:outer membrane beta-barrel protein n=1 Tax=Flavobacterium sp. 7A TaxID=2940571 RepID=UPI002226D2DA|nr:outer membrane beta-barrel protein [Flavobacterium sp. 7A]MCW2119764.1 outer membrane protein [Flavobacterium sp. 7A]
MKKVILLAIALLAISFANAQDSSAKEYGFSKGNVLVEGNLGFNSSNNNNTEVKTNSFNFAPKVGYFLSDKFAIGAELGLGTNKKETAGVDTSKNTTMSAGVFGRYYFLELGQRFKTYADANVAYGHSKDGIGSAASKANGLGAGIGLGINYFVTKRLVLNFALKNILSYSTAKVDAPGQKSVSNFGFDLSGNIANPFATGSFGIGYIF